MKKTSPAKTETKKSSAKNEDVEGKLKERKEENTPVIAVNVAKKEKSQVNAKSGKENKVEQTKNKKNLKNQVLEKPLDFDDGLFICFFFLLINYDFSLIFYLLILIVNVIIGDWEQAHSKKNKRTKKEEETPKKSKKSKKSEYINGAKDAEDQEKIEIKDKVAKETENKELKEKNQKDVILEPVADKVVEIEIVPEKKEQVKEVIQ